MSTEILMRVTHARVEAIARNRRAPHLPIKPHYMMHARRIGLVEHLRISIAQVINDEHYNEVEVELCAFRGIIPENGWRLVTPVPWKPKV